MAQRLSGSEVSKIDARSELRRRPWILMTRKKNPLFFAAIGNYFTRLQSLDFEDGRITDADRMMVLTQIPLTPVFPHGKRNMQTLDFDEILNIHNCLVADFAESTDPISPPGLRDDGSLLHSAVSRQYVGMGQTLKYPAIEQNAATLCYGVCNNHCFHNGNKRTALVTLLCHLDKNGLTFNEKVSHDKLYDLMLKIASHQLTIYAKRRHGGRDVDGEVAALGEWIRKHTRDIENGERVITYRELRSILKNYGFEFDNPRNNFIDIVKYVEVGYGLIFKKTRIEKRRYSHIAYPRDGAVVGRQLLRKIRQDCALTENDGFDSTLFYNSKTDVDVFISTYRKTLRRLAKV